MPPSPLHLFRCPRDRRGEGFPTLSSYVIKGAERKHLAQRRQNLAWNAALRIKHILSLRSGQRRVGVIATLADCAKVSTKKGGSQ